MPDPSNKLSWHAQNLFEHIKMWKAHDPHEAWTLLQDLHCLCEPEGTDQDYLGDIIDQWDEEFYGDSYDQHYGESYSQ